MHCRPAALCGLVLCLTLLDSASAQIIDAAQILESPHAAGRTSGTLNLDPASELPAWEAKLFARFRKQLYPLLTADESGCIDCHSSDGTSPLVFTGQPLDDFRLLLDGRYLSAEGPDTLLGRITSGNPDRRMPKDSQAWPLKRVQRLRRLTAEVERLRELTGKAADEQFPRSLLGPYDGTENHPSDSQFLTYRQLQGKLRTIFDDDGQRGDRNVLADQVAMFGGADFESRYNESAEATTTYLTALEMVSRDVAERAYQLRRGPFTNWQSTAVPPTPHLPSDPQLRNAVAQLYQRILYRQPTEAEIDQSITLIRQIHLQADDISVRDTRLAFELTVIDPGNETSATHRLELPVSGEPLPLQQIIVDQTGGEFLKNNWICRAIDTVLPASISQPLVHWLSDRKTAPLQSTILADDIFLSMDNAAQRVVLHNLGTHRNVSFAGIELRQHSRGEAIRIGIDAEEVQVDGAWEINADDRVKSFEDGNRHKGASSISVNLRPPQAGNYQVALLFRAAPENTAHALVELFAPGLENCLSPLTIPQRPEPGTAQFWYDCSEDALPFVELPGSYRFDPSSFVEISNAGTALPVTAGAVEFIPLDASFDTLLIDSLDAEGSHEWSQFDEGRFRAYNVKGKKLHDNNQRKGELKLRYRPAGAKQGSQGKWHAAAMYRIRIYYPGKRDQESRVPVKVRALASSPIVQIEQPRIAKSDAAVRLDASASYTVDGRPLKFVWRQLAGPAVAIEDPTRSAIEFSAPRLQASQMAWTALCSALMRHPDFLFTRPPALDWADARDQRRLQLMRLALDLVGRPPTAVELTRLDAGEAYEAFVDEYLASDEFRDFYFHRVRLYLESQGTVEQDEPARLWCHIAFEDRPLQEILTADYTVDENFQRQSRPAHHGRTGLLTTKGFIQGKPGLPHYNYAAQVTMLFLGYVYEVPPEIVEQREGVTALGTTDPNSSCYSCHKILTPLAFQRLNWTDEGDYRTLDEEGLAIDASDQDAVEEYPFAGTGMEAFATQAVKKERFLRTMINTHFDFYFGRPLRHREDERDLYRQLWDHLHAHDFKLRQLIRAIVTSSEYNRVP